jgi:hypothetical protein
VLRRCVRRRAPGKLAILTRDNETVGIVQDVAGAFNLLAGRPSRHPFLKGCEFRS